MDAAEFGDLVRRRSAELRLSQAELARRAGLSTSTVHKLLGRFPHKPTRSTALDLARVLEWDPAQVLAWLGEESFSDGDLGALRAPVLAPAERLKDLLRLWCRLTPSAQDVLMEVATLLESRTSIQPRPSTGVTLFEAGPEFRPAGTQCAARENS